MPKVRIVSARWIYADASVGGKKTATRLECTLEDGSLWSCDDRFDDWKRESPSLSELSSYLNEFIRKQK